MSTPTKIICDYGRDSAAHSHKIARGSELHRQTAYRSTVTVVTINPLSSRIPPGEQGVGGFGAKGNGESPQSQLIFSGAVRADQGARTSRDYGAPIVTVDLDGAVR